MNIIEVSNLNFEYPGKKVLHDVSFSIPAGNVTALVGPNGAGKTTLLRCLTALERPVSGNVLIDGIDVFRMPRLAHREIGYLSDFFGLYDDLSVRRCLTYMAYSQKLDTADVYMRVEEVAKQVDIENYLDRPAGSLSRGYRQRLGVGLALMHKPKLLLLDEPASGMDPEARIGLSQMIHDLREGGMTIVVSSHILAELEDYCTDMLVIRDGRILRHITIQEQREQAGAMLKIGMLKPRKKDLAFLGKQEYVTNVAQEGNTIICGYAGDEKAQAALLAALLEQGAKVTSFERIEARLKDTYMALAKEAV